MCTGSTGMCWSPRFFLVSADTSDLLNLWLVEWWVCALKTPRLVSVNAWHEQNSPSFPYSDPQRRRTVTADPLKNAGQERRNIFCHRVPICVTVCQQLMAQWFFIRIPQSISLTLVFIPVLALPFVVEWIYQRPKLIAKISTPNAALGEHNSNTTSRPVTCVMHMLYITKGKERTKNSVIKSQNLFWWLLFFCLFVCLFVFCLPSYYLSMHAFKSVS